MLPVRACFSEKDTTTHGHTTTTTPQGISCTVCNNVLPLCFQLHHVASCPEPYCINEVTNTADGSKTIIRRCGTLHECNTEWWGKTSDDPDCQTYNPNGNVNKYIHCTFCCTTENCNADVVPKPGTLYTPPDK
ncbi:hypothetical protein MAR_010666 [Mya arenaria]|uniref:Uncharacterized protein n=1 Tax=Mya arenaria TaxID=6604 RepID=A0ABY7FTM8_MYAAR|nr:hypothetical protein MAR_010666 [Mya arenaria]